MTLCYGAVEWTDVSSSRSQGDPDRVTPRTRFLRTVLVSALAVLIFGAGPVAARPLGATRVPPKVVLIVGPAGARHAVLPAPRRRGRSRRRRSSPRTSSRSTPPTRPGRTRQGGAPGRVGRRLPRPRQRLAEHLPRRPLPADPERLRPEPARRARPTPTSTSARSRSARDQARAERGRDLQPPLLRERQHRAGPRRGNPRPGPAAGRQLRRRVLPGRRRCGHRRRVPRARATT